MVLKVKSRKVIDFLKKTWTFAAPVLATIAFYYLITIPCNWLAGLSVEDKAGHVSNTVDFINSNQLRIRIGFSVIFTAFVLISIRLFTRWRPGRVAKSMGAFYAAQNFSPRDRKKSTRFLRSNANKSKKILILGASGWSTFGSPDSPLHEAITNCREVNVLIANPYSEHTQRRAQDIGADVRAFQTEIINSSKHLCQIDGDAKVTLKFYDRYPKWKFIILDDCVWTQQYPKKKPVSESPCFAFQSLEDGKSIVDFIQREFDDLWEHKWKVWTYDFSTDTIARTNPKTKETFTKKLGIA